MSRMEVARSLPHQNLQVLQAKCLRIVTNAPWYIGNRQIQDNLRVLYLFDHNRSLTEGFDSKLADVGKLLVEQLGKTTKQ